MAEFGNAGKAGKSIRAPFNSVLQSSADNRMISLPVADCFKAKKTDTTSKRGKRVVSLRFYASALLKRLSQKLRK